MPTLKFLLVDHELLNGDPLVFFLKLSSSKNQDFPFVGQIHGRSYK